VLLSDNAHASTAFSDFCERHGLTYRYWREVPRGHFYPGAGIGMTIISDAFGDDAVEPLHHRFEPERSSAGTR
jgi:hypothetical protein